MTTCTILLSLEQSMYTTRIEFVKAGGCDGESCTGTGTRPRNSEFRCPIEADDDDGGIALFL